MDALRVGCLAACRLRDADAAAGLRHIALAGLAVLPELLRSSEGSAPTAGSSSSTSATGEAAAGGGSTTGSADAAVAAGPADDGGGAAATQEAEKVQWRPDSLVWLEGAQLQAGMRYEAAAAAYQAALQPERLDSQTQRFVAERLAECYTAACDWDMLQRLLDEVPQVRLTRSLKGITSA